MGEFKGHAKLAEMAVTNDRFPCPILVHVYKQYVIQTHSPIRIINPQRACAARVTVVVLSVRLSVHILFSDYRLRDGL